MGGAGQTFGCVGPAGHKKMAGFKILVWLKHVIYELLSWFYEALLAVLVSSLYSLHMLYWNEFSTQFTVFYINSYSLISMKGHYFWK